MDKIKKYLLDSAETVLSDFERTAEMLEYPEIQADKQLYLRLLTEYNSKKPLYDVKTELAVVEEELAFCKDEYNNVSIQSEKDFFSEEIKILTEKENTLLDKLKSYLSASSALPCGAIIELKAGSSEESCFVIESLCSALSSYAERHGFSFKTKRTLSGKSGLARQITMDTDGADASVTLNSLGGIHKIVYASALTSSITTDEISITVFEKHAKTQINEEKDLRIEVFHSGGAGGQNINKVETAIRVIHIPTGITVTCQDERSQLKNKKRAIENIKKRILEADEAEEKKIAEATRKKQAESRKRVVFDLVENTVTDKRNEQGTRKFSFPLSDNEADLFIENL